MSGDASTSGAWSRAARTAWLIYTVIAIASALVVLAVYVNTYDDYDISERLRATGRFARTAMRVLSFPLGLPVGALANGPLESALGCGDLNEPCSVFVDWHTHFAAIVAQIVLLRRLVARRR